MIDCRRAIVLVGVLAQGSACGGEAPEGTTPEAKPAAVEGTDAKASEPMKAEASPPEPPSTGHAVAKEGSLLFLSSTGDGGFELPLFGWDAGMTVKVVGEKDGRLVVETSLTEPEEHHCAPTLDGLADFRLRLYLAKDDLLPVLTAEHEHSFADGSKLRLARGVPVPVGSTEIVACGTAVQVPVPAERLGRFYSPGLPFTSEGSDGKLESLEGAPLGYEGPHVLREGSLFHEAGNVLRFGATERTNGALVIVRNPCLEATVWVALERFHSMKPKESGRPLASPLGGTFAAGDDEDGTGRPTKKAHEVKAGTAITWPDGSPAGQVTADHRFTAAPRNEGGRTCFYAPLVVGLAAKVKLCFAPGAVDEIEVPAGSTGLGTGSGSATGSWFGRGKKRPTARQSKLEVKGSHDKDIIRRIVRAHLSNVRSCHNQGWAKDPSLAGNVSIQLSIGPRGSVSVATVADRTLEDENVAKCIAKAIKRWTFPKSGGGSMVVVTYVLQLADDRPFEY